MMIDAVLKSRVFRAEPRFGGSKEPIYNQGVAEDAGVYPLGTVVGSSHDSAWEDDMDAAAVVKHVVRPPSWCVAQVAVHCDSYGDWQVGSWVAGLPADGIALWRI